MKHSFRPSQIKPDTCAICHNDELSHGTNAECQSCGFIGTIDCLMVDNKPILNFLVCATCQEKDTAARVKLEQTGETRVAEAQRLWKLAQSIDSTIKFSTDLFNAETVSIADVKRSIDTDESIPADQKLFKLAEFIKNRFEHFQTVIFESRTVITDAINRQRAQQTYLNELSNKLKKEEREALRLADVNYKPAEVKIVKPKAISVRSLNKAELKKINEEFGLAENVVQMLCLAKGWTPENFGNNYRRMLNEAKSMKPDTGTNG